MLIDLFVYVNHAPGGYSTADVAKAAKERGLDAIVMVDRAVPVDIDSTLDHKGSEPKIFVGVELHTDLGVVLLIPQQVAGPFADKAWGEPDAEGVYALDHVLTMARTHQWAVIAVQPFDQHFPRSSGDALIAAEGIHAVLVTTGGTPLLAHDLALEAAMARQIPIVAGSNTRDSFNRLGSVATALCKVISTQKELCAAIIEGDVWTAVIGGRMSSPATRTPPPRNDDRNRGRGRDRNRRR